MQNSLTDKRLELATEALRAALLTVHLLAGALAGMGPMVVAACRLTPSLRTHGDAELRRLAVWSLSALVISLAVGALSTLLLCWPTESAYQAAALRVPSGAYAMLAAEWLFTLVLLIAYLATWKRLGKRPILHGLIALVAGTNLLYHFPTMMLVIGGLADEPTLTAEAIITRPVFRSLITTPELMAKTLHYWSLSLLTAGVFGVAVSGAEPRIARVGAAGALAGLGVTLVSGVATLTQLPPLTQRALIGDQPFAAAAFALAIVLAMALGYRLLAIAFDGEATVRDRQATITILSVTTFLMTLASRLAATSV